MSDRVGANIGSLLHRMGLGERIRVQYRENTGGTYTGEVSARFTSYVDERGLVSADISDMINNIRSITCRLRKSAILKLDTDSRLEWDGAVWEVLSIEESDHFWMIRASYAFRSLVYVFDSTLITFDNTSVTWDRVG